MLTHNQSAAMLIKNYNVMVGSLIKMVSKLHFNLLRPNVNAVEVPTATLVCRLLGTVVQHREQATLVCRLLGTVVQHREEATLVCRLLGTVVQQREQATMVCRLLGTVVQHRELSSS